MKIECMHIPSETRLILRHLNVTIIPGRVKDVLDIPDNVFVSNNRHYLKLCDGEHTYTFEHVYGALKHKGTI